jgi:hypothetical protein
MADWKRRLLGMGLPCLLAFALDATLTMWGQPEEYWAGNYSLTTEGSPFFRQFFALGPSAAIAGYAAWAGVLLGLILLLPEVLAVCLSLAVVFGHTAGAAMWLDGLITVGRLGGGITVGWFQTARGMLPTAAAVLGLGLWWSLRDPGQGRAKEEHRPWNPVLRWGLVAALLGIGAYMMLFPH